MASVNLIPDGSGVAHGPPPAHRSSPSLSLLALGLSLLGLLLVAVLLYEFKFHHVTASWHGLPTRLLFAGAIGLAAAPFYVTPLRRVPLPYLLAPIGVIVFLYPIFSPYGLPYSHDPVYNFQFSQAILQNGFWKPLVGVTSQARVYSYFPGGAVFNAEVASLTGLPELATFNWSYDLLRLLVIPLAIYALTVRLFGTRPAPLAVLFYLTIPSTEMNVPTQQDFAIVWFLLALVALAFLATSVDRDAGFLRGTVVVATVMVVISHHVTTYLLVGFLLGLAVLPWLLLRRDPYAAARLRFTVPRTLAVVLAWIAAFSLPVIESQRALLTANLTALLHPGARAGGTLATPGQSFPLYEIVFIGAAIALLVGLALFTLLETYRAEGFAFAVFGLLTAVIVGVVALPFFSTGFSFLAFRVLEYAGLFMAPAAAWWLTRHFTVGARRPASAPGPTTVGRPPSRRWGRAGAVGLAAALAFVVVVGGSMVPLSTRDQFSPQPSGVQVSSPLFVNESAYAAASWAATHLDRSQKVWGDYLTYTVFGGFGQFEIAWDAYPAFETPTFNASLLARLHVGDYVVTDLQMTTAYSPPMFFGPATDQPAAGIPIANLEKYNLPTDFAVVYENPIFTIYETVQLPPPGT